MPFSHVYVRLMTSDITRCDTGNIHSQQVERGLIQETRRLQLFAMSGTADKPSHIYYPIDFNVIALITARD